MDILGISAFYHDSAACLVRDGAIVAAAQEERFTRKKNDAGFPTESVRYCLREGGVSVPREISVTGFDNLDLGRKLHPTLTTIEQNSVQLMERAGALLLREIKLPPPERGKPTVELVAPELVIGESTGPAQMEK